ncbi:MAG: DNA repair protein RecO [Magnetococcales bacterium]|nr:DNA repair protein RecO [Magnetococcales bacterium]
MQFSQPALVLRRTPYQNSSMILNILTREEGRLGLMAKGLRRSKSPNRASLAGYHTVLVHYKKKQNSGLALLNSAEIIRGRHVVGMRSAAVSAVHVIYETLYRNMPEHDPDAMLFDIVTEYLDGLDQGNSVLEHTALVLGKILKQLGYGWDLSHCVGCGVEQGFNYFSVRRGGVLCNACGQPHKNRLFQLSSALCQIMRSLEYPLEHKLLSAREWQVFYGIGQACMAFHSSRKMVSDKLFRQVVDIPLSLGPWNAHDTQRD